MLRFYLLACGLSWAIWAPLWLPALGVSGLPTVPHHHLLGAAGPLLAAFVVAGRESGRRGVAQLLGAMVAWRGRAGWIVVSVLAPVGLLLVAATIAAATRGEAIALDRLLASADFPGASAAAVFAIHLLTFGFGEEVGWRGFALPRLQSRHTALGATLLLTSAWAVWHLPLFVYRPGYASMGWAGAAGWLLSLATGAILLTWLFNESRGSVLVVALFHASMDLAFTAEGASTTVLNVTGALVALGGVVVLAATGPRNLARRPRVAVSAPGVGPAGSRVPGR